MARWFRSRREETGASSRVLETGSRCPRSEPSTSGTSGISTPSSPALEELIPQHTFLHVEATAAPDIRAFLEAHDAGPVTAVARGTWWPREQTYLLPLTKADLEAFRELAERHAEPEICTHLVVYREEQVLLTAYDAFDGDVFVTDDLPADTIDALRRRLLTPDGP
jgi:hypothetical protein